MGIGSIGKRSIYFESHLKKLQEALPQAGQVYEGTAIFAPSEVALWSLSGLSSGDIAALKRRLGSYARVVEALTGLGVINNKGCTVVGNPEGLRPLARTDLPDEPKLPFVFK
ncbi:hypothetical protein A3F65_02300 [Candidatus Saccharibacteria bacterium RIFCSPHIGHO2_12_FULL_47_16b]|nr:MAG: hypothetical protein A3F65_02300 [Candidatus Saccharibacteria bacterium RIFCSPHIGHO2_12_FULL_47_16b]OGL38441.1 MAG: hypothetical protein A3J32_00335 [Candidatus Saccharibacteria bacterium RIFCSPLOWO2_02_FULL_46_7]